jgi:hypothetical protein
MSCSFRESKVVPVLEVIRRPLKHDTTMRLVRMCGTLARSAAGSVVVHEDVQLADAVGHRDPMHPACAKTRPRRNAAELHRRQRALNALGEAEHVTGGG